MFRWKSKKIKSSAGGKKIIGNTTAYAILASAVLAMTFFGVCTPNQGGPGLSGAAGSVDGEEITKQEFRRAYENAYRRYSRIYQDGFDPAQMQLAQTVLNSLVQQIVVYRQAKEAGLLVSDGEVEEQIIELFKDEKGKFQSERFEQTLKYNGYSEASFLDEIRRDLTVNKYRRFAGEASYLSSSFTKMDFEVAETKLNVEYLKLEPEDVKVSVTNADIDKFLNKKGKKKVEEYYNANNAEFNKEKKVKASHILIAFKGASRASKAAQARSKEDAQKLANKVMQEAKGSPNNFAALAKRYTDEPSGKEKAGDLGFFGKADMVKPFSDAAFSMKVGDISDVVESQFGFHVIKVTAIQPEVKKPLKDATREIARKLVAKEKRPEILERRAKRLISEIRSGGGAKVLKEYGLKWKETGEFSGEIRSIPGLGSEQAVYDAVFTLQNKNQVYEEAVSAGENKFILRLKSRTDPEGKKLDEEKRESIARSQNYRASLALFDDLTESYKKKLDSKGEIWLNKDFLAIDQSRAQTDDG